MSNYVPLKHNNTLTTPHQLVFHDKPNLQNLLPMFSVAYVRKKTSDENTKLQNVENHSIAVILVGRSTVANSHIFYHPHTSKIITTDDYYLDETIPAGPAFDISYAHGLHFNSYAEQNVYLRPPTFKPTQQVFVKYNRKYAKASIITLPTRESNIYTVQIESDGSIHQYFEKNIKDIDPYLELHNDISKNKFFPDWLIHGANITIKTDSKFQHGTLLILNEQYFFRPGRSEKNRPVLLKDFQTKAIYMLRDLTLHKGHPSYKKIEQLLQSRYIGSIVASHVSAKGLSSHHVPHLVEHKLLKHTDRTIWNDAYKEEYYGLKSLPAWITITQAQYEKLRHKIKPIPTMAISTIKFDENGQPKRAKYRIVVLGQINGPNKIHMRQYLA